MPRGSYRDRIIADPSVTLFGQRGALNMTLRPLTFVVMATLAMSTGAALAGNDKGKGARHSGPGVIANCPPGLAKKNPPCIPPGQAKKAYPDHRPHYNVGDRISSDYRIIRDVDRYGLPNGYLYYLVGREVFRISPETGRVLAFIGLADALLN
jgi:Ni/Co efflux regulator RcnB